MADKTGMFRAKRIDNGEIVEGGSIIKFIDDGVLSIWIPQFNSKCVCTHDEQDNITAFENCIFYKVDPTTLEYLGGERCEYCTVEESRNPSGRIFYKEFPHNTEPYTTLDDAHLQLAHDDKCGWVLHFEDDGGDRMFDVKSTTCPICGKLLKGD